MTVLIASCPACGQPLSGLARGSHAHPLRCRNVDCPRPLAALEILSERTIEHIVTFERGAFSLKHPLRERLDDELLHCEVGRFVGEFGLELTGGVFGRRFELGVPYEVWMDGEGEDRMLNCHIENGRPVPWSWG